MRRAPEMARVPCGALHRHMVTALAYGLTTTMKARTVRRRRRMRVVRSNAGHTGHRAISRTSYEHKRSWPLLKVPVRAQRWNYDTQPTIYVSHEPHVAAAEKLGHLAASATLRSARAFWSTTPATDEVLVLSFKPDLFCARIVDLSARSDIADFLGPDYTPSQSLAADLIASDDITALRAPSAEFWPDLHLNEAYFVTVGRQPRQEDFPPTAEHGWYRGAP